MNARCSICGDAYGTRYVCAECRADPANVDWVEGREDSVATTPTSFAGTPWGGANESRLDSIKSAIEVDPLASNADIARATGASVARVSEVRRASQPSRRRPIIRK